MEQYTLTINDRVYTVEATPDMPLLWVLRDLLGLKGTKYGCGKAQCGACTVHFGGQAMPSCLLPVERAVRRPITTIEGLSADGSHPVQRAWQTVDVPQCGYCQAGQIMQAASLLQANGNPSEAEIEAAMSRNICRCGTYPHIREALALAVELNKK